MLGLLIKKASDKEKSFIRFTPRTNVIKLSHFVADDKA
jgi:hypothetical protein